MPPKAYYTQIDETAQGYPLWQIEVAGIQIGKACRDETGRQWIGFTDTFHRYAKTRKAATRLLLRAHIVNLQFNLKALQNAT